MTTTSNFNNKIRQVNDVFDLLINEKSYLLRYIANSPQNDRIEGNVNVNVGTTTLSNTKFEWLEEKVEKKKSTIASNSLQGSTSIEVADASKFKVNEVLEIQRAGSTLSVQVFITAIDLNTNILTVVRPYADTTDADINTGDEAILVSVSSPEGKTYTDEGIQQSLVKYNLTQIFDRTFAFSETAQRMSTYDKANDFNHQLKIKMIDIIYQLEASIVKGRRNEVNTKQRTFGGLEYYIGGNDGVKETSGGVISKPKIDNIFSQILERGGMSENMAIIGNANQIARISALTDALTQKQQIDRPGRASAQNLGNYTATYTSPYFIGNRGYGGSLITSYAMSNDKIIIADMSKVGMKYLIPFYVKDTTSPNVDQEQRTIKGECSLMVENGDDCHGIITGLTA